MGNNSDVLVKEILNGGESAMELLVKKNYNMVHAYVYRYTGDYQISYDITQEVFIKMMKNLHRYKNSNSKFEAWLLKIACNHCKDYFKSKSYKERRESIEINNVELEENESVVNILERNERRKEVKKAVDSLPKMQKEAIILKYYNDLKIHEISEITGENINTIKSRLFNGVKNLKKYMGGKANERKKAINK